MEKGTAFSWTKSIALATGLLITAVSCQNPLLEQMQNRIVDDVSLYLAGDAPRILAATPGPGAIDIPTSAVISAVFDLDLDPATITGSTVSLTRLSPTTSVEGTLSYDSTTRTASFTPATRLEPDESYRLTVSTNVQSAKGAALASTFNATFTTRYFHDDEIGIDLTYSSSDLVLNSNAPIYIQIYALPLPYPQANENMTILGALPITAPGKYRIPRNLIPNQSSQAVVFLFHDIDNNYDLEDEGAGNGDSERIIKTGVLGNLVDPEEVAIILGNADGYYILDPAVILETGTGYSVTYADGSPFPPDGFESLDASPSGSRALTQGLFENARNLHSLTDIDYLRFTPPSTDHYIVEVKETGYQLRVELYDNDSNALTRDWILAASTGNNERITHESSYHLTGGQTYILRVDSPSGGLGPYSIRYRLRDVPEDQYEPNNHPESPTSLLLGRQNLLSATLSDGPEVQDVDVYEITVEAGQRYAIEVTEKDNHFGSYLDKRDIQFGIAMYTAWDGESLSGIFQVDLEGFYQTANGRLIFDASRVNVSSGSETRWIVVSNQSPQQGGTGPRPSAEYTILYTWGPDAWDKEYVESLDAPGVDDAINGTTILGTEVYIPGDTKIQRTIYSGTNTENPGSDVDWFRFTAKGATLDYLVSAQPALGPDGIAVNLTLYRSMEVNGNAVPDTGDGNAKAYSQIWANSTDGTVGFSFEPWTSLGYNTSEWSQSIYKVFWIQVSRNTEAAGNPATGRYTLSIRGGADNEDIYYIPDTKESDIGVDLGGGEIIGIDETPWIGQLTYGGIDFSNRNELAWSGSYGNRYTRQALGEDLDQYVWSIYRRDYDYNGEPDGANNPSDDWDFTWMEIPAGGLNGSNFYIQLISDSNPAIPLKLSYWKVSATAWTSYKSDGVVRQTELGTPTGVYTIDPADEETLYTAVNGVAAGEFYVFRIERNGTAPDGYPASGVYWFRLLE